MKINKNLHISIRIIILFTIAILLSFIPEHFANFFGDFTCSGSHYVAGANGSFGSFEGCTYGDGFGTHGPTTHWGYRHWLWFGMGLSLAGVQIAGIVKIIIKKNEE